MEHLSALLGFGWCVFFTLWHISILYLSWHQCEKWLRPGVGEDRVCSRSYFRGSDLQGMYMVAQPFSSCLVSNSWNKCQVCHIFTRQYFCLSAVTAVISCPDIRFLVHRTSISTLHFFRLLPLLLCTGSCHIL